MSNTSICNYDILISEFIKAFGALDELGSQYFDYVGRWQNAYNIVEAYRLYNGEVGMFGDKLGRAIAEYGIGHFEYQEQKYAKKAYYTILRMDKEYSIKTGHHFKGYTKCETNKEIIDFLIAFDDAYNVYMAGGHIEYEDR